MLGKININLESKKERKKKKTTTTNDKKSKSENYLNVELILNGGQRVTNEKPSRIPVCSTINVTSSIE